MTICHGKGYTMNNMKNTVVLYVGVCFLLLLTVKDGLTQPIDPYIWPKKVEAVAVVNDYEFEVKTANSATFRRHALFYIFNDKGKSYGHLEIPDNLYLKSKNISARICDVSGKEVKKLKNNEIVVANVSPDAILYADFKRKIVEMNWPNYPYSVEFNYEIEFQSLYFWPDWYPQLDIPVLKSSYTLILNEPVQFNSYSIGVDLQPRIEKRKTSEIYRWQLENIEPVIDEDWMPPENNIQKAILFSPRIFERGGFTGSFNSWKEFGEWYNHLLADRFELTAEIKAAVHGLLNDAIDERSKLEILYHYLQDYTRYVAVHIGIGGLQPHAAATVFHTRYGDCKDLSTLMIALCREAGIEAYPVLVKTRDKGEVWEDFPNGDFNHFIVLAIVAGDSIWIESTADQLALGQLTPVIEGCNVLVMNSSGGQLVKTPSSTCYQNRTISKLSGKLLNDGSLIFEGKVVSYGHDALEKRIRIIDKTFQERLEWSTSTLLGDYFPQIKLDSCVFRNVSDNLVQPFECHFKGKIQQFGTCSGNRMFFNPAVIHRETASDIPKETDRKFPINYKYPYTTVDTVILSLPSGYLFEALPEQQDIQTNFGGYTLRYEVDNHQLTFIRILRIEQKLIPVAEYQSYLAFSRTAVKSDNSRFVLKRNY